MNRRVLCGIASAVLLSACGTTVQVQQAGGATAQGGLSGPAQGSGGAEAAGTTEVGTAAGAAGLAPGVGGKAGGAAQVTTSQQSVGGPAAQGAGAAAAGPALTKPVRVAYTVANVGAAADALGAAGYNADQQTQATRDEWKALLRYANSHGGVGGRKIEGLEYDVDTTTDQNTLCTKATEDDHVDAFLDFDSFNTDDALACFGKHRTPLVAQMFSPGRDLLLKYRPYLATTYGVPDRSEPGLIDGLNRVGYFKGATVGAVFDDDPLIKKIWATKMKPQLDRLGVKVVAEHYFAPTDAGQQQPQAQSAVLDFKSKGVTNVIFAANVLVLISFAQAEQNAAYLAKLGLGDYWLAASAGPGNAEYIPSVERALKDAVAVTLVSSVVSDHPEQKQGSTIDRKNPRLLPGMRRCLDVLSAELKVDYYKLADNQRGRGWPDICDSFFLWWETAQKTGAAMTAANWGLALPQISTSFQSAIVHQEQFGPAQYDGAADYRVGRYYSEDVACACYKALLPDWYPLPSA
jgi:hypothetical protein